MSGRKFIPIGEDSALVPCYLCQVRPSDSSLTHAARPENSCTTTLVLQQLVLETHWGTQDASVTFEVRAALRDWSSIATKGFLAKGSIRGRK